MTQMIDPDGGWQYGFPKPKPLDDVDMNQWLIDNGYPESLIEQWESTLGYVPCRYFSAEESVD